MSVTGRLFPALNGQFAKFCDIQRSGLQWILK